MTDTTPDALRALADDLQHGPVIDGVRVRSRMNDAADTLRALADEKEALVGREGRIAHRHNTRILELQIAARDARLAALEEARRAAKGAQPLDVHEESPLYGMGAPKTDFERGVARGRELAEAAIRALIDDTGPSIADELAQARGFIKDYQRQLSEEMVRSSVAEAKLAKVQGALDDLAIRLGDPQRRYDKIGPTWTGKSGHEYSDMSELLDFATEIGEQTAAIRALIDREPAPVVTMEDIVRRTAEQTLDLAKGLSLDEWTAKVRVLFDLPAAPTPPEPAPVVADGWGTLSPEPQGYTVERHGDGWAIYKGRGPFHHGYNLARLAECSAKTAAMIERALNAAPTPPEPPP